MRVREFRKEDVLLINVQDQQKYSLDLGYDECINEGLISAWTFTEPDGTIIACGGISFFQVNNVFFAWSLLSNNSGKYLVRITRFVKSILEDSSYEKIYIVVNDKFPQAKRWAKMLGFKKDTVNVWGASQDFPDEIVYERYKNG